MAFFRYGFARDMGALGASTSNLAIVVGNPTPSEYAHNETLVRRFLASEYQAVRELLEAHRPLLDAIADRLLWDPIVDPARHGERSEAERPPVGVGAV